MHLRRPNVSPRIRAQPVPYAWRVRAPRVPKAGLASRHGPSGVARELSSCAANALRVKKASRFTPGHPNAPTRAAAEIWADIDLRTEELMRGAQRDGLIDPRANLDWTRQVYYALLGEALNRPGTE